MTHENMFGCETDNVERTAAQLAEFIAIEDAELEQLKKTLNERKTRLDAAKEQLATLLIDAGLDSIKLGNGLAPKVQRTTKFFKASGVSDEQLFDWLNANMLGDIIKPYVHFQTLQATMKDFVAAGGEAPETVFNVSEVLGIRMNGKSKFLASRRDEKQVA